MVWGVFLPINMDHTLPKKTQLSQVAAALPTLSPRRTRGPSSPACVASFSVRVIPWRCCIWSTWIGRAARASQEGREQLHCLLPSTRSSTSRRFRCICASSGNPVIYGSSSSCFVGKILFCASVATPYPFIFVMFVFLLVLLLLFLFTLQLSSTTCLSIKFVMMPYILL
jgi:hypothetical protein